MGKAGGNVLSRGTSESSHQLEEILCCPSCKGTLELTAPVLTRSGRLKSGIFLCPCCQEIVGTVTNFKYDFLFFDKAALKRNLLRRDYRAGYRLPYDVCEETVKYDDPRLELRGSWEPWEDRYQLSQGRPGDAVVFSDEFLDVSVRLLKHPWSGVVRFLVDGMLVSEVDLYQPRWSEIHWFPIANDLPRGPHTVEIVATGKKNERAAAAQVLFHELVVSRAARSGDLIKELPPEVNRALPLFPVVVDLVNQVPAHGWILECGGGDRRLRHARYVNIECQRYQLPTVWGNVLKLPFRDNSFDFVFSQALLEHVPDPFAAVDEMCRVTKPAGLLWSGMAFLQPLHAAPSHYFNASVWGIQELFKQTEIMDVSWFGELSFTIGWLLQSAGVAERMERQEYEELMNRIRALDALVTHEALREVASGVAVLARKPVSGQQSGR
jgi:predicted SAM-dependent methyltransferase